MDGTSGRIAAWLGVATALGTLLPAPAAGGDDGGRRKVPRVAEVLRKADEAAGTQAVPLAYSPLDRMERSEDRTLSPYFHVAGGDPDTERLPLKETSAEVSIAGVIARVKVRQVFANDGKRPIEAVYVFPASTRAAVHGMRMRIGARTIVARIERRQKARARYEQARREGRRASLLEQERPNVFTMNVANILPGDRVEVELDYSELLVPEESVYEFVYPAVVGPRYGGGADPEADRWIANPYLHEGEAEPYRFGVRVHVETGIPLKELSSPSHRVTVTYRSPGSADVALAEAGGGNRDFVLRYRLAGDRVETGLLLHQGEEENFFVLMVEPPLYPPAEEVPPREYLFLLDVSGSMAGFPLETARTLMKDLLAGLRPTDLFNVVLFSGASSVLHPAGSVPATEENLRKAWELIERQQGGGGTELMGGLSACYGIPARPGVSRTVVVVTDGYVGVEAQVFKFIREHLDEANLFAFGIGSGVNRGLIEGMARAGMGEPFVVLKPARAREQAERLRRYIEAPVLTDVAVSFEGFGAYDVSPEHVPDLLARRPLVLFGKYAGTAKGRVRISGTSGKGRFERTVEATPEGVREENAPLRYLWARKWVETLEDELHMLPGHGGLKEAIVDLGLAYDLVTRFTSFVAIDSEVVNRGGTGDTVKQPLPLPEGVSDLAVGEPVTATAVARKVTLRAPLATAEGGVETRSSAAVGGGAVLPPGGPVPPSPVRSRAAAPKAGRETAGEEARAEVRLEVVGTTARGLASPGALVQAVEARLKPSREGCTGRPGARLRLRLRVDGSGRIVAVEVVEGSGDGRLDRCVGRLLTGIVSPSRPTAAGTAGILEITLEIRRSSR